MLLSILYALFHFNPITTYKRENFTFVSPQVRPVRVREDVSLKEGHTAWKAGAWFSVWDCLTADLEILITTLYSRINFV